MRTAFFDGAEYHPQCPTLTYWPIHKKKLLNRGVKKKYFGNHKSNMKSLKESNWTFSACLMGVGTAKTTLLAGGNRKALMN